MRDEKEIREKLKTAIKYLLEAVDVADSEDMEKQAMRIRTLKWVLNESD